MRTSIASVPKATPTNPSIPSPQPRGLREKFAHRFESMAGRHDETQFYGGDDGDPGLCGGPDSISWEIHSDLASVVLSGPAAILMEVLHPSVMHGVFTQSSYRDAAIRRARNTLGYVLRTTYGTTEAATRVIERVKLMHSRVHGTRADGIAYRALDPELIAWVHTCIPWAIMSMYDQTKRPLSREEKSRYLKEQAVVGRMGGASYVPESMDELEVYVERMRPHLAMNDQTVEFLGFLFGRDGELGLTRVEHFDRSVGIPGAMSLMPEWARRMTGTYWPPAVDRALWTPSNKMRAALLRKVYPEAPCVALARSRAAQA